MRFNDNLYNWYTCSGVRVAYFFLATNTGYKLYDVAEGVIASKPTSGFFEFIRNLSPNLRRLYLSDVVLRTPVPDTVEFLSVSNSCVTAGAFQALPRPGGQAVTRRLLEMELSEVTLLQNTLRALPNSVERLRIRSTDLRQLIYSAPNAQRLRELDVSGCTLWLFTAVQHISRFAPQLTTLKINHTGASDLRRVELLPRLEVLEADNTNCNCDDLQSICTYLSSTLRSLSLARCQKLKAADFLVLVELRNSLRFLDVSSTNINAYVIDTLSSCMPDCVIVHSADMPAE